MCIIARYYWNQTYKDWQTCELHCCWKYDTSCIVSRSEWLKWWKLKLHFCNYRDSKVLKNSTVGYQYRIPGTSFKSDPTLRVVLSIKIICLKKWWQGFFLLGHSSVLAHSVFSTLLRQCHRSFYPISYLVIILPLQPTTNWWHENTTKCWQRPHVRMWKAFSRSIKELSVECARRTLSTVGCTLSAVKISNLWRRQFGSWTYLCRRLWLQLGPMSNVDALEVNMWLVRSRESDGSLPDAIDARTAGAGESGLGRSPGGAGPGAMRNHKQIHLPLSKALACVTLSAPRHGSSETVILLFPPKKSSLTCKHTAFVTPHTHTNQFPAPSSAQIPLAYPRSRGGASDNPWWSLFWLQLNFRRMRSVGRSGSDLATNKLERHILKEGHRKWRTNLRKIEKISRNVVVRVCSNTFWFRDGTCLFLNTENIHWTWKLHWPFPPFYTVWTSYVKMRQEQREHRSPGLYRLWDLIIPEFDPVFYLLPLRPRLLATRAVKKKGGGEQRSTRGYDECSRWKWGGI